MQIASKGIDVRTKLELSRFQQSFVGKSEFSTVNPRKTNIYRHFLVSNVNISGFLILIIIREHVFN